MAGKLDYLKKAIGELSDEQYDELVADLLASQDEAENNKAEEMSMVLMSDFTEVALAKYKSFGSMQGMSSGFNKIDDLTMGLVGGELILVAGKTSRGKTTLSLNIANNVALDGNTVLFVTLEMTHSEITQRSMFINNCDPEKGEVNEMYTQVAANTVFQATDELRWDSIDKLMQKAKEEMNCSLVVIDHLHYFTRELQNVSEDLGRITKEFKKNAVRHDIPVILISHVRKTRGDEEATMDDMRGSSYMAQDADIVLMVGRSDDDPRHTYVKIEKNRNRGKPSDRKNGSEADNLVKLYTDGIKMSNNEPFVDPFNDKDD